MRHYHDRDAHELSPLTTGQPVGIQDEVTKKWFTGIVTSMRPEPWSYEDTNSIWFNPSQQQAPTSPIKDKTSLKSGDERSIVDPEVTQTEVLHDDPSLLWYLAKPYEATGEEPRAIAVPNLPRNIALVPLSSKELHARHASRFWKKKFSCQNNTSKNISSVYLVF